MKKITTWETPTAVAAAGPETPARLRNRIFTATDPRVGGVTKVANDAASCACRARYRLTGTEINDSSSAVEAKYVTPDAISATPAHFHSAVVI